MGHSGKISAASLPNTLWAGVLLLIGSGPLLMGVYFPRHQYIWCAGIALLTLLAVLFLKPVVGWRRADLLILALPLIYLTSYHTAINKGLAIIEIAKYITAALFYLAAFLLCQRMRQVKQLLFAVYLSALVVAAGAIIFSTGWAHFPDGFTGVFTSFLQYRNVTAAYLGAAILLGLALWAARAEFDPAGKMTLVFWPASLTLLLFVARGTYSRGALLVLAILFVWFAFSPSGARHRAVLISFGRQVVVTTLTVPIYLHYVQQKLIAPALLLLFSNLLLAVALEIRQHVRAGDAGQAGRAAESSLAGRPKLAPGGKLFILIVAALLLLGVLVSPQFFARYEKQDLVEKGRVSEINVWHRFYYSRDAWQLVWQRPFTGWGGGGWQDAYRQQQSYLYHSKRVHNQYAEVAVETGLPGLLVYLGVWWVFIGRALDLYRRSREEERIVAGATLGYLLFFALHTTIDFDFSYLAIMSTVWAVGGAVSKQVAELARERDNGGQADKIRLSGQDTRERAKAPPAPGRAVYHGGLAFLLLSVLAGSLWLGTAEWYYQGAVRRWVAGEQKAAQKMIWSAIAMHPLQSDYYQLASKLAIAGRDTTAALQWARKAQEVAPRSVLAAEQVVQAAQAAGQVDVAVAAARRYSQLFPCDIAGRDRLARLQLDAAIQSLQQGDKQRARQYMDDCRAILEQTARFWEQVPEKYRKMWYNPPRMPTESQLWLREQIAVLQAQIK